MKTKGGGGDLIGVLAATLLGGGCHVLYPFAPAIDDQADNGVPLEDQGNTVDAGQDGVFPDDQHLLSDIPLGTNTNSIKARAMWSPMSTGNTGIQATICCKP